MNKIVAFIFVLAFSAMLAVGARAQGTPGDFDYYTLVLSWSPTYCADRDRPRRDDLQCSGPRPYAFVVHGFWPQYDKPRRGYRWPNNCDTGSRPWVPQRVIDDMLDIMPSRGLIIHQYRKHGVCSGLGAKDYFELTREAFAQVSIPARFQRLDNYLTISPDDLEKAFLRENPTLRPEMVSIDCKNRRLREMRICFSRDLEFRACGPSEHQPRLCSSPRIVMPPVR